MKHCSTLFSFLLLLLSTDSTAQTLHDSTRIRFRVNAEIQGQHHFYAVHAQTVMPEAIRAYRTYLTELPITFDTVTDNPMKHAAIYAAVKTTTRIANKVELKADLYGEYRGLSYGSFSNENRVFFPVISASFIDSFQLQKTFLKLRAEAGQFLNQKMDEGLMLNNIDAQWLKVHFRYRNLQVSTTVYADMLNGIGLNVDDLVHISLTHFFNQDRHTAGISYVLAPPYNQYIYASYHSYFSVFGHITTKDGNTLYAQAGMNLGYDNTGIFNGLKRQLGFLLGIEQHVKGRKISIDHKTEIRYYGRTYNAFHSDQQLRYRKPASNPQEMYSNTIGKYLYPIRKFNTPFSQWSVFTEYLGYNLLAGSMTGNIIYRSSKKIFFRLDYDINAIYGRLDKDFVNPQYPVSEFIYPFFKAAIKYYPTKEGSISFFISNKTMNLDLGYPTQYLMRWPFAGVEFHVDI